MCATSARHRVQHQDEITPEPAFWAARSLLQPAEYGGAPKHARRGSSKYALHIGRVGALAVSLGVGLAVAHSSGTAYAESDTDSSVAGSRSDGERTPAGPKASGGADTGEAEGGDTGAVDDLEPTDPDVDGDEPTSVADEDPAVDQDEDALPASEEPAEDAPDDPVDTDNTTTAPPVPETPAAPKGSDVSEETTDVGEETLEDESVAGAEAIVDEGDFGSTDEVPRDVTVVNVVSTMPAPVQRASVAVEKNVETVGVVSALVSSVLTPFADTGAPAQAPWFDVLLAWVRRQITHTFFNRTPIYGPITTEQIFTGQLFIDLKASDPNGDPLTYEIIQPTNGLVVRDLITGKFIYTPTAIVSGSPLHDSFQVVIRDDSEHLGGALGSFQKLLHGIARLFGLAKKDNITVTVPVTVNPIVQLPPGVITVGLPVFKLGGVPVKVLSSASITDLDSDRIAKATIKIATSAATGDVLNYVPILGNPIAATWDAESKTLTLSGLATAEQYEQALLAVTFSATQGGLPRGLSISVTDDDGVQSLVPGAALVTVLGLPPAIGVIGAPVFKLGGSPVRVVSSVTITDVDSDKLSSATLTIGSAGYKSGDVLNYVAISGNPIGGEWDAETRTLTLSGVATIAQYEAAIKAVTFTTTEGGLARGISVSVTDETDKQSLVPGAALVTVLGLPPLIGTVGAPVFKLGGSPVRVVSSVTITDVDSDKLSSATLTIGTGYKTGDVLNYIPQQGNPVGGEWDAETRTLTLSGVATIAQYEAAIKAVSFSTTEGGLARGISISVTDETDKQSLVPGAALVTVLGLPPLIGTVGAPVFKLGGSPVKVVSSVTITDVDSDKLSSATLTIGTGYKTGDVLNYIAQQGNPIDAEWDAETRTLTLSGVATIAQYEAAIKAVSFSTTEGGLGRGISISVTDETDKQSLVPGAALVTVLGLPPAIGVIGAPVFKLGGSPVKVVSSVTITDVDSDKLSSATLTIGSAGYKSGDVLNYVTISGNPIGGEWDAETRTLTLSGLATIAQYEAAIKAVTFTTTEGGLARGISVSVTDETDKQSLVPGAALVTVLGLPPLIGTVGAPVFKLGGSPVKVVSSVTITDVDSDKLSSATLTIGTGYKTGDVLNYIPQQGNPIDAEWDAETRTLTLSGVATIAQYEAAIKAVTFSTTEGGLARGISIAVTDETDKQSLVPGAALVTVLGLPPAIGVIGAPVFKLGGSPVRVVSSVTITDVDSDKLSSATLTIGTGYKTGDVLNYIAQQGNPVGGEWDAETRTLTLSGVATLAQYEAAIKAVTFSTTEGGLARGISVSVTDETDKQSLVPGAALVTVLGLPPAIGVIGAPVFKLGGSPVRVVSSVTITDVDSDKLSSATLTIGSAGYKSGDVLNYVAISGNPIGGEWDAETRTLTLSGVATIAQYEAAIKAVTFSTTEGGLARGISISVTDETDKQSLVPGAALVTVLGLPPLIGTVGAPVFKLGGSPVKVVSSVTITDVDSDKLSSATLTIGSAGYKSGDVLNYVTISGNPIGAEWDAGTRTLTLSGLATIAQYEAAIKAVSFSTTEGGLARGISISVTDETDKQSLVPGAALVTVLGLPPLIGTVGAPVFKLGGSPVRVVSSVTITDVDSDKLSSATLTIGTGYKTGDLLDYVAISGNPIGGEWDAETRTLTLSGVATIAQYEAAIKAVTFSTTEGGLARGISISVTDETDKKALVPGSALVSVIGIPPAIGVIGAPVFKLGGSPVRVVSSVTITDVDSDKLSSATLTIGTGYKTGDVLNYIAQQGNPVGGEWDAETRTLTLSGVATLAQYEAAIKAVTFSTTEGGLARGISISVTDETEKKALVPGAALVTVLGLPPAIGVIGAPVFKLGGSPVKVVSSVTITDVDSDKLSSATLTIGSAGYKSGDVLNYVAISGNPIGGEWDAETRTLTLSGVATIAQYEAAIKAVTFTTTEGGLARGISVSVTDETDKQSLVPGAALVTVLGLPPLIGTVGAPVFKLGGSPVKVVSSVTITDVDSDKLSSATLTIGTGYKTGDVLNYIPQQGNPIDAEWDAETRTLTLSGVATIAQYEAAIKAVTFSTTEGGLARGISIAVTDETDKQSLVPGAALVTVLGIPPAIGVIGAPVFKLGGSPVKVVSSVTITDVDSDKLSSATLTIGSAGYKSGDVLNYVTISGNPIGGEWDAETRTLTLSGVATIAQYEAAIKAVTFTTTEGGLARGISVSVTDETDKQSLVPGAALVTVLGLPPLIGTVGAPIFKLGGSPVKVVSSVTITDVDSDKLSSATLTIGSAGYKSGDVLNYVTISGNPIGGEWDAGTRTLTLSGLATLAQYEAAIKAVTFSTTEGGLARGISVSVTDETDKQSLVPGAALVTVLGIPPAIGVIGAPIFKLGGSPVRVVSSVTITDVDSDKLSSATLTIGSAGYKLGDVLNYVAISGNPIGGEWDAETRTLTLSGVATLAQYEAAIQAVTFSTTEGGLARGISISVTDETDKKALVPGSALVSVIGIPPAIATVGAPVFKLGGSPVRVVSSVTITDVDSDKLSSATLTIGSAGYKSGDVLNYVTISGNPIGGEWDAETRTLTLSGVATIAQYEAAIKAVTFSTTEGGLARGISISVTDETDKKALVPGSALVSVIGIPPAIATVGAPVFKLGGSPVKVVSSVTITDVDSDKLSSATLTIGSAGYKSGDVLNYVTISGNPIDADWDAETRTLTLSGLATIAQYEAAIKAVTFSTTEGGLARGISVSVTDETDKQSLVPGAALVTVLGIPPAIGVIGAPVFKLGGSPVKVVSSVTITDVDSDKLSSATLTIGSAGYKLGDVLNYVAISGNPVGGEWDAETRTLTLSGVATLAQYEAAIKAVTFTTTEGGLARGISVSVTDETDKQSLVPGAALVTVLGIPPAIGVIGAPVFKLGGSPVKVVSSVTITDVDSDKLSSATLTIGSAGYKSGDVLNYVAISGNPIGGDWDAETRTLTLSGVATIAQYEAAIKAVSFSTTEGGLARGISIAVTDETDKQSLVPGAALVTVLGLPPAIGVIGAPVFKLGGSPVRVVSSVTITDVDSDKLSSATLTIGSAGYKLGDVLNYVAISGNPIGGEWDAETRTLTLSGVATIAQYEAAIKAVTFSTTEGGLARGISVSVTDETDKQSLVPGAALVTVLGLPPAIGVIGAPIFKLGGSPVKVVSSVTITDVDSDKLSSATLTIGSAGYKSGDVLNYVAISGNPIGGEWDAGTRTLTLSGLATIAQYEAAIKAVTFSTTEGGLARGISISVTDETDKKALVPGSALVSVIGIPPAIATVGAPVFKLGGSPVKVVSSVTITDVDSDKLSSATLTIVSAGYKSGDVLNYVAISGNPIGGEWDAETRTLTLSGVATIAQYEAAIKAVTFSTTEGGLARGISVSVTDETDKQSLVPGAALVTVLGLPPLIGTVGAPIFKLGGSPVKVVSSVTITDVDSDKLSSATLTIGTGYKTGDFLNYIAQQGNPVGGEWDAETRTLTLSGVATIAQYEAAIQAVTFSTTEGGLARGISVSVTDETDKKALVPGSALVSVIGIPPAIATVGAPVFKLGGSPVRVVSSVTITDVDSDKLSSATLTIGSAGYKSGDVLNYVTISGNPIGAEWDAETRTLTLSGVATLAQYEAAIQAVTFTTTEGGLARGISISVTDETDKKALVPGSALVSVIGIPPAIATVGAPVFKLGGSPVKVVSSVTITDVDSDKLSSATLTIGSAGYKSGDVLNYVAISGNPIDADWDAETRTLTLSGLATIAQYEAAIKAVTFTTTEGGLGRGISISVTDETDKKALVPGSALVSVIGLPPAIATVGAPIFKLGGSPVRVVSSVTITDVDSDKLSSATLTIGTGYKTGDVLNYIAQQGNPIGGEWDAETRTLTLSGVATLAQYEAAIKAVTFTTNQGGLPRAIQVDVADDADVSSLVPGSAMVSVVGLPPSVVTIGASTHTIGTAPVRLLSSVSIADADSDNLSRATIKIATLGQTGDVLSYIALNDNPITAAWDPGSRTLTLSGVATKAQYEDALEAVTFSATGGALIIRGIAVSVIDDTNVESLLSGAATVTARYSLPPSVVTVGTPTHTIGTAPVKLLSSATITDSDSEKFSSATVTITALGQNGDILGYEQPSGNPITAAWDSGTKTLTLSGVGTKAQYEQALEAVTFAATGGVLLLRVISISVTDDGGVSSSGLLNGAATAGARENSAPILWSVTRGSAYDRNDPATRLFSNAEITDDLGYLSSATLKITLLKQSNDTLDYVQPLGNPIVLESWDANTKTLKLSGTATVAQYEEALKAVTFWANQGSLITRTIEVYVTDNGGKNSLTLYPTVLVGV